MHPIVSSLFVTFSWAVSEGGLSARGFVGVNSFLQAVERLAQFRQCLSQFGRCRG